jgi:hypothetical protein
MYSIQKNYLPIKLVEQIPLQCPLCNFKKKINMQFYQLQAETNGGISNTKQISATCFCTHCNTDIPNLKWTKDFHNFYKEKKKSIKVKMSFKMKRGFKIAIGILVGMFALIFLFFMILKIYFLLKN